MAWTLRDPVTGHGLNPLAPDRSWIRMWLDLQAIRSRIRRFPSHQKCSEVMRLRVVKKRLEPDHG